MASSIKAVPSALLPGRAANKQPSVTARLSAVKPGSALARLGFQEGDLLVSVSRGISGQPLAGPLVELPAAMCAALSQPSSQTVLVTLLRGGQRFDLAYAVE